MKHYYINLAERTDRKENMEKLFSQINVTDYVRIEGVDGNLVDYQKVIANKMKVCESWIDPLEDRPLTPGEVGCILSHIIAWNNIAQSGQPGVILEDDLYLSADSYNENEVFEKLKETDLLYLTKYNMDKNNKELDSKFEEPGYCYWTSGYAVTPEGAGKLLNKTGVLNLIPADEYLPMMIGKSPLVDQYAQFNDLPKLKSLAYRNNVFHPHSRIHL